VSCRLRRGAALFASPGKLTSVWCHDEIDLTALSPGDGCECLGHDETVKMASKKQGNRAPALAEGGVGLQPYWTLSRWQDQSGCNKI